MNTFSSLAAVAKGKVLDAAESARQMAAQLQQQQAQPPQHGDREAHARDAQSKEARNARDNQYAGYQREGWDEREEVTPQKREEPEPRVVHTEPKSEPAPKAQEMDLLAMSPERKSEPQPVTDSLINLSLADPAPLASAPPAQSSSSLLDFSPPQQPAEPQTAPSSLDILGDFTGSSASAPAPAPSMDAFDRWIGGGSTPQPQQKAQPAPPQRGNAPHAPQQERKPAPPPRGADMISFDDHSNHKPAPLDTETIHFHEMSQVKRLGAGAFAEVWLCDWRGTPVALKQILPDKLSDSTLADFHREADILKRMRHPNVMMFMGASLAPPNIFIVTEFCQNGTLFNLLHQSKTKLDTARLVSMALDIARGLAYIHGFRPAIIHRDVKTLNVLVDKNLNCKISDFGLAVSSAEHNTLKCGTYQYMAPEMFSGRNRYDEKIDVFAFGIMLWEMFNRDLPYSGMLGEQVPLAVENGHRPPIPTDCPPFIANLMKQCWHSTPTSRPTMAEVVNSLKQVNDRMSDMFGI